MFGLYDELQPMPVKTYYDKNACYMQWLPSQFRYW
jgi:hypothetical protein